MPAFSGSASPSWPLDIAHAARGSSGAAWILAVWILAFTPLAVRASVDDIVWNGPPEIAASPVDQVPSPAGASAVLWNDQWRVVYEEGGVIYMTSRSGAGWDAPVAVSTGGGPARNPRIADVGPTRLQVLWEDDRTGHAEVWTRRFNGSAWSAEFCLSTDAIASGAAVIVGDGYTDAFAAWEDSSATGFRVWARMLDDGVWESAQAISTSPAQGREPSVAYYPAMGGFLCAWTDYQTAAPRIMLWKYGWSEEFLVEGTKPSLHAESCCGDAIVEADFELVYQGQGSAGAAEVYGLCFTLGGYASYPLSADDGLPSVLGQAAGFGFFVSPCAVPGGYLPRYFAAWTDRGGAGRDADVHWIADGCEPDADRQILSAAGLDGCGIAFGRGDPDAPAEVLAYWIETQVGGPALMARRGHLPGCWIEDLELPPALVLAPEGVPPTIVHAFDHCSGRPIPRFYIQIAFDAALDAALTWDPLQPHPVLQTETDESGDATFAILGGGCSQAGWATASCGVEGDAWPGARSPDVDGDCVVRLNDLQYVQGMLGTSDFCADLDGSGLVDQADVAIVSSTLGDHCSDQSMAAQEDTGRWGPALSLGPTPASGAVILRLASPVDATAEIAILSADGRLVRGLDPVRIGPGVNAIPWDARDAAGRPVPSGIYFAVARMGGDVLKRVIVVAR